MTRSRIFGYCSSWWTTSAIMLCLAVSYVACLFGEYPYADWVRFLFHRPPGMLLYLSLAVNILLATVRIIRAGTGRPHITPEAVRTRDIYAKLPADVMDDIAGLMKQKGFAVAATKDSVHAIKNRYSFLPGTIARAGIVILLVSVFASAQARKSSEAILHEGEAMHAFGRQVVLKSVTPGIPDSYLQLGEEGTFRLDAAMAELQSQGPAHTITAGFPVRIHGLYYRITHVGLTQPLAFQGREIDRAMNLDLDLLPPGRDDVVTLPFQELSLAVALQPEKTITKGLVKGKEYNLRDPLFHLVFQRGREKEKAGELTVREGGAATFSGISLSLGRHSIYVKVRTVSDPALPFIHAGAVLTLLGIILMSTRFFWYAQELTAVRVGSTLHVGYGEEFFRKWASQKFHSWMQGLERTERTDGATL